MGDGYPRMIHEFLDAMVESEDIRMRFESSEDEARQAMTDFGLPAEKQEILVAASKADQSSIKALRDELKRETDTHIAMVIRMIAT